jgi:hypothetical protein
VSTTIIGWARLAPTGGDCVVHERLGQRPPTVDTESIDRVQGRRAGSIVEGLLKEHKELAVHAPAMASRALLEPLVQVIGYVLDQEAGHTGRLPGSGDTISV